MKPFIVALIMAAPSVAFAQTRGPFQQNFPLYSNTYSIPARTLPPVGVPFGTPVPAGTVGLNDFLGTKLDAVTLLTPGTTNNITVDQYGRITAIRGFNSADITGALGYTPYNATNPSNYITAAALAPYAPLASPALTGTPTAPTAAAGTNTTQIATTANVVSNFAAPPTAGYGSTTPEPVAATSISASGAITPSGGIAGSTTGTSPAAGYVGQVLKASATGLALTAATITNLTSVSLTPGNYICTGAFSVGTVGGPSSGYQAFLTTTSASQTGIIEPANNVLNFSSAVLGGAMSIPTGTASVLVTSTETVYLGAYSAVATTGSAGYLTCVRIQ